MLRANWPSQSPPPPPLRFKIKILTHIDTNTVHNATVDVDFVKKDTFLGASFVEDLPKSCLGLLKLKPGTLIPLIAKRLLCICCKL